MDLPETPITHDSMGTDCSTPITRFFYSQFWKKNKKKHVFGASCVSCEIRKIGLWVIHVEFTFTRISVLDHFSSFFLLANWRHEIYIPSDVAMKTAPYSLVDCITWSILHGFVITRMLLWLATMMYLDQRRQFHFISHN